MTSQFVLAILVALGFLLVAGYAIWQWGPGLRTRTVKCPELKLGADVLVDQREAEFGNLKFTDIKRCSLLKDRPVDCGKECLAKL